MSVRLRTRVAPSRMSWLQPAAPGSQGAPERTRTCPRPRLPAARAVDRLPESSAASTTTTAADRAAFPWGSLIVVECCVEETLDDVYNKLPLGDVHEGD
jgi:hypothetical protein